LTIVGQGDDERRRSTHRNRGGFVLFQKRVVIPTTASESSPSGIERDAGNDDGVKHTHSLDVANRVVSQRSVLCAFRWLSQIVRADVRVSLYVLHAKHPHRRATYLIDVNDWTEHVPIRIGDDSLNQPIDARLSKPRAC